MTIREEDASNLIKMGFVKTVEEGYELIGRKQAELAAVPEYVRKAIRAADCTARWDEVTGVWYLVPLAKGDFAHFGRPQ